MTSNLYNSGIWWFEQLPSNLRPKDEKVEKLENLRSHYFLPNEIFVGIILSSPAITRQVQKNVYELAKEKMPNALEKELLEAVGLKMTEEEIQKEIESINSLNDLIEYFIQRDKEETRFTRDLFGIGSKIAKKINTILEE
jgi:hypothetical protein